MIFSFYFQVIIYNDDSSLESLLVKVVLPQPKGLPVRDLNVVLLCDSTVKIRVYEHQ